jgi:hypothetical protein
MSLEVVVQLSGSDEYCIKQLVDLQIPCLGFVEDLTDVVHRALDSPDPPGGGGFAASSSIGSGSGSSRSTGSGGTSEVQAPVTVLPRGSDAVSGGWDPMSL